MTAEVAVAALWNWFSSAPMVTPPKMPCRAKPPRAKGIWDTKENPLQIFDCPAPVDGALSRRFVSTALGAHRALGCRVWSRVDVRLDASGMPQVLEVNPLPGILPDPSQNSCFPKAARAAGISYDELIVRVLDIGLARYGMSR
jgi:D-alanine-D-alanine ligase